MIFININGPRIIAEVWDQVALLLLPWGIRVCCEGGKGEWLGGSDGCRSSEATGLMSDALLAEGRAGRGVTVSKRGAIRVLSFGGLVKNEVERQEVGRCSKPGMPGPLVLIFFIQAVKF